MRKVMKCHEDLFFDNTPIMIQIALTKDIMNHGTLSDFEKRTMIWQYYHNLITNGVVAEQLNYYAERR